MQARLPCPHFSHIDLNIPDFPAVSEDWGKNAGRALSFQGLIPLEQALQTLV
jgi:hypothetical protein